jgi:integrase
LKIAEKFEEIASRRRSALHVRRVMAELHTKITGDALPVQSLRGYVTAWLTTKTQETKSATMSFYQNSADRFLDFMGDRADQDIAEVSRQDLLDFRAEEAKTLAAKTVNHRLKFWRMVFRTARRDSVIADDPAEFVKTVQDRDSANRARRPFTIDEMRAVLRVADEEWQSMIQFGLYSGQRLGDIARLTWANVDVQAGELRLVTEKTGKRIIHPLAGPLKAHVESLPVSDDPDAPIHPRAFDVVMRQEKSGGLSNQFGRLLAQAGLRKKQPHRKTHGAGRGVGSSTGGLSFHALRHTAVTLLKEAGIPAATVMELVGHDSKEMSQHYTHVGRDSLTQAAEAFPVLMVKKPEGKE